MGVFFPIEAPMQTIYLKVNHLDKEGKKFEQPITYCLPCAGNELLRIRQELLSPQSIDEVQQRKNKELVD
jgi:hypothetical protein